MIDWFDHWLVDWLICWLIDWLTRLSNVSSQSGGDSICSSRQSHHSSNSSLGDRSAFFCFFAVMPFYWDKRGHFIVTREAIFLKQEMPFYLIREAIFLRQAMPFYWNNRCHFIVTRYAILLWQFIFLGQKRPYYCDKLFFMNSLFLRCHFLISSYFLSYVLIHFVLVLSH